MTWQEMMRTMWADMWIVTLSIGSQGAWVCKAMIPSGMNSRGFTVSGKTPEEAIDNAYKRYRKESEGVLA